jgi:hypothetical protein
MGARRLLGVAGDLARLDATRAALAAGVIDWARAAVIADELAALDDDDARAAEALVLPRAGGMTTGQLRPALRRAVIAIDPGAARRRRDKARRQASVQLWTDPSGNVTLAGREIDPAQGITADQWLTAQARWLQARGTEGTLQYLRQAVFTAALNGRPVTSLVPEASRGDGVTGAGWPAGDGPASGGAASSEPAGSRSAGSRSAGSRSAGSRSAGSETGEGGGAADRAESAGTRKRPDGSGRVTGAGGGSAPAAAGPGVTGTVNLTMPLTAWLGLSDRPGEAAGYGALDADACRDLAAKLAAGPGSRWCLTLTGPGGEAVAHACARRGPPGPGLAPDAVQPPGAVPPAGPAPPAGAGSPSGADPPPGAGPAPGTGPPAGAGLGPGGRRRAAGGLEGAWPGVAGWLAGLRPVRLEAGTCAHQREAAGYRPPRSLAHLVGIRQRTSTPPGCRRPARRCDLDHVTPFDQGGRTCECNLHPVCRKHHQAKQCPGWAAAAPEPGTVIWTTPGGRSYATRPEPYPL